MADKEITAIITGDVMNSRIMLHKKNWLEPVKKALSVFGKSPKTWEIFRGDSFQLEIKKPEDALLAAITIKAAVKSQKGLDVRMAIGIGEKNYEASRITESNGQAFIHSGEKFESLKKNGSNLAIRSSWPDLDQELNIMISLALIAMDKWSSSSAELVHLSILHKAISQKELGEKIGRTQSSVSERQTRAHYGEIMELENFYRNKIKQQLG